MTQESVPTATSPPDISDMMLQRDVIGQFGDTYPAMKPKDWMHLIRDYLTRKGEPSFDEEDDSAFPAMAAEECHLD